jgi:hypothetical protein
MTLVDSNADGRLSAERKASMSAGVPLGRVGQSEPRLSEVARLATDRTSTRGRRQQ